MASVLGGPASGGKDASAKNLSTIANATARLNASGKGASVLGQSYADTGSQSFKDQLLSHLSPLMDTADTALNVAERPAQGILHGLQAFSGTRTHALDPSTLAAAAKAFGKGFTDVGGTDNLNLRATVNQDPNVGGRWAGLLDTLGTAAIDPLSAVTAGGGGALGKVGLKIIEEKLGAGAAKTVAKGGFKALSTEDQAAAREAILNSTQAANKQTLNPAQRLLNKAGMNIEGANGPQKLLDEIAGTRFRAGALEDGAGLKFAGKTVLKNDTVAPLANALHLPQAAEALKGTAPVEWARHAFQPLAKVEDAIGAGNAAKVADVVREGRAATDKGATDASTQARAAIKEAKIPLAELRQGQTARSKALLGKLEGIWREAAMGRDAAVARGTASDISSKEAVINYLKDVEGEKVVPGGEFHNGDQPSLFEGSGSQPGLLGHFTQPDRTFSVLNKEEAQTVVPAFKGTADGQTGLFPSSAHEQLGRSVSRDALKAVNKNPTAVARALHLDASATPANIIKHLQTVLPNNSLEDVNSEVSKALSVKNAYEMNPLKALTDQTVKAHREAAVADTLKGLMDIKTDDGVPVVSMSKFPGAVEKQTVLGKIYGTKEVLDLMDHAAVSLTDDESLKTLTHMIDKWGKLWRGYATVPALFGVGFHERNLVGNVFNMWLGGFHDVSLFKNADKIGRAIESGTNKGATIEQAIDSAKSLTADERHWTRLAYQKGVIGDSFFRTDMATAVKTGSQNRVTKGIEKVAGQKAAHVAGTVGTAVNPVSTDNVLLKSGTYVGRRIEDNSRLAMFIDQMRKHGDPSVAADEVKKALFDYSELTPTEQRIKKVIPFYTYMRKNTPLQLQSLAMNPGKFSNMAHFRDNMQAGAPEVDGKPVPQYALQNGAIPLFGGNTPIVGSMATPFQAAFQQIQPLLELASQAPGAPKSLRSEGGTGKALREMISNVGGGPLDLAKFATEQATGKSLLTGSDLPTGTGGNRLAKALIPLYGKGESTVGDLTSGDKGVIGSRALSSLLGLSTTALTDKSTGGETSRRAKVLAAAAKGTPTTSQLRKTGKMPKVKAAHVKKVAVKKTPLQKAIAARKAATTKVNKAKKTA